MQLSKLFTDHLTQPQNVGELEDATAVAEEVNPACGDRLRLSVCVRADRIEAARFLAYGCPATLVCGSALTTLLVGLSVTEALKLNRTDISSVVGGLPARKGHAAALAIETLYAVLSKCGLE